MVKMEALLIANSLLGSNTDVGKQFTFDLAHPGRRVVPHRSGTVAAISTDSLEKPIKMGVPLIVPPDACKNGFNKRI